MKFIRCGRAADGVDVETNAARRFAAMSILGMGSSDHHRLPLARITDWWRGATSCASRRGGIFRSGSELQGPRLLIVVAAVYGRRASNSCQEDRRGQRLRRLQSLLPRGNRPDLFWYGVHGIETLFTVMRNGCESVTRISTPGTDVAVGIWKGSRVGTFRGIRTEQRGGPLAHGGTAFGTDGAALIGPHKDFHYRSLVVEIVKFLRTGTVPVSEEETLEIYAFM